MGSSPLAKSGSQFALLGLLALGCLLSSTACGHKPRRPDSVSTNAVYVSGAKVGWWQECSIVASRSTVRCQIWNGAGFELVNDEFLPYDGGPTPRPEELTIASNVTFPGPDRIFLSNGRVLLPRSRFSELKGCIDWLHQ
jgi:hypothetical protein